MVSPQTLLGEVSLQQFVADHFQRLPYSRSGMASSLLGLAGWEQLVALLAQPAADVNVCRSNQQYQESPPHTADAAARLVSEGYTLLVRHAERLEPRLQELAAAFERDFAAPVNIHVYCTPGGEHGFGWHYDAEEVFIVQTAGRKEYELRKNTVNPWPVEETLPADMRYEREIMPLLRCELAAGDWLYIPSGYWHRAIAKEMAISLAIGVMPRTGVDFYAFLRKKALDSLLWRQRLPVMGAASALESEELRRCLGTILVDLKRDLERQLADPQLAEQFARFLTERPRS